MAVSWLKLLFRTAYLVGLKDATLLPDSAEVGWEGLWKIMGSVRSFSCWALWHLTGSVWKEGAATQRHGLGSSLRLRDLGGVGFATESGVYSLPYHSPAERAQVSCLTPLSLSPPLQT